MKGTSQIMRAFQKQIFSSFSRTLNVLFLTLGAAASGQEIIPSADPNGISAQALQGDSVDDQTFTLQLKGGSRMVLYSIFTDQSWFAVSPESGQLSGEQDLITVKFFSESLNTNDYHGTIKIMGMFSTNEPISIPVTLHVAPRPGTDRWIRIPSGTTGLIGNPLSIPVQLVSTGDVSGVAFSLRFDPAVFAAPKISLGADAKDCGLLVNSDKVSSGQIGIQVTKPFPPTMDAPPTTFKVGASEFVILSFLVNPNVAPGMFPLTFGDYPILRALADGNGNLLSGNWPKGTVQLLSGYEGTFFAKVEPVSLTDWVQIGRFTANLAIPTTSQFQRADCAPRDICGDGILTVADWIQAGRYYAKLDPIQTAGGPVNKVAGSIYYGVTSAFNATDAATNTSYLEPAFQELARSVGNRGKLRAQALGNTDARQLIIQNRTLIIGSTNAVSVLLVASGDENAVGFSARFDPQVLRFVSAQLGAQSTGATLLINPSFAQDGEVGIALALPSGGTFKGGNQEIVRLFFEPVSIVSNSTTSINLSDTPLKCEISSSTANLLSARYSNATDIRLISANADETLDSDEDGLFNWQEILVGTDPLNANSCFRVAISRLNSETVPKGFGVSWSSIPGSTYSVWRGSNCAGPYTRIRANLIATDQTTTIFDTTAGDAMSFFYAVEMKIP